MIDTIRIYAYLTELEKTILECMSTVTSSFDNSKQEFKYQFTQANLKGSWETTIQIKIAEQVYFKEKLRHKTIIECSLHKLVLGHNCFGGSLDIISQTQYLLDIIYQELKIYIDIKEIMIARIDLAQCYKLQNEQQVQSYIHQYSKVPYKNRLPEKEYNGTVFWKFKDYSFKLYNKFKEFNDNDMKKKTRISNTFYKSINGILRFEVTFRKKKLEQLHKQKNLTIYDIDMDLLIKNRDIIIYNLNLLTGYSKEHDKAQDLEEVKSRLYANIKSKRKATLLLNFYIMQKTIGLEQTKEITTKSTFYRNLKEIKKHGIDLMNDAKLDYIYDHVTFPNDFNLIEDTYKMYNDDLDCYLSII